MKSKPAYRLVLTGSPAAYILAAATAALLATPAVRATDFAWDPGNLQTGGSGSWINTGTPLSWDSGFQNPDVTTDVAWVDGAGNNAYFGGTAGTVTLGTAITAGSLNFSTAGYIINTGTNTLTLNKANTGTAATINFNGAGTLALASAGDGTGAPQNVNFLENVSMASSGTITVGRAGAVAVNKTLQLGSLTLGANTLTKTGAGTLVLGSASNSFGGVGSTINITDGMLQVASNGALGDSNNVVLLGANSATKGLRLAGGTAASPTSYTLTGRTITLNAVASGIDVTQNTTATLDTAFGYGAVGNTLQKNDNGVLAFASGVVNSALTGAWTISAGAIQISGANNLNASGSALTVSNAVGSALQLTNGVTLNKTGTLTLNGSGLNSMGALENYSDSNTVSSLITLSSASVIGADTGSTLNLTGGISGAFGVTFNTAGNAAINISGTAISANVTPITKIGNGTLTLGVDSSSVVAPINVDAGTLTISTGKLGGTGTVALYTGITLNLTSTTANRLGGRPLYMSGGSLNMSAAAAETTGALTVEFGQSVFNNTSGQTLAFGALTRNASGTALFKGGSTINFSATPTFTGTAGGNNTTNKAILPWAIFDAGAGAGTSFATTDAAGTTVRALAASESLGDLWTANANVVLASNPLATNTMTINSLTFNSGSNALAINTPSLAVPTVQTLTLSSGGILAKTSATISGGALASLGNVFTTAGSTLTISSQINTSITKAGAGTLVLSNTSVAFPAYSGNTGSNTYINEGTVQLGANNALGNSAASYLTVETGATLDLNGKLQTVGPLMDRVQTTTLMGIASGLITSGTGNGTLLIGTTNPGNQNGYRYGGSIQGTGVAVEIRNSGGLYTQYLAGDNTYGGITQLGSGQLSLVDNGRLSGTSAIAVNGGILQIDNTGLSNNNDRVKDTAAITLNSGNITYLGRAQTASTETLGALTVNSGASSITVTPGGTGVNSADLTLASVTHTAGSGATVNFILSGTAGAAGSSNGRVNVTDPTALTAGMVNGIIPWMAAGSQLGSYVPYTSVDGVSAGGIGALGTAGYAAYDSTATTYNTVNQPTWNAYAGGAATITGAVTLNSLGVNGTNLNFTNSGDTINVASGALLVNGNVNTIGATLDSGRITAGGAATSGTVDLYFWSGSANNNTNILNSRIINSGNGAITRLVLNFRGDGNRSLTMNNGLNSYTGGTILNTSATLNATSGVVIPNDATGLTGLVINNSTVTMSNVAGQIGSGNAITMNDNSALTLIGNNSFQSLTANNNSGGPPTGLSTNNPTVSTGGIMTLTNAAITTTSSVPSALTINGLVNLPSSSTLSIGAATFNGTVINPLAADVILNGVSGGGGSMTKSGTGVVQFNAIGALSGALDVTGGGLQSGGTNGGSRLADVTLENGTWINLNGNDALFGSLGGTSTSMVTNTGALKTLTVGSTNANSAFAGSFQRFNDTLVVAMNLTKIGSGTMSLTGNSSTASGALTINSSGGGGVTFSGNGVNPFRNAAVAVNMDSALNLNNTTSVANRLTGISTGSGVTLSGGTLNITGGNADESFSVLTSNAGLNTITTGANTLSLKSFTKGTGGALNIGSSTVKFITTPAPLTNQIIPGVFVGNDFANVGGFNAITAFAGYFNVDAGTSGQGSDNVKPTGTQTNVTASKSVNSLNLTLQGAIAEGVTLNPMQILTLTSGSLINNGGGNITGGFLTTGGNLELIANYATNGSIGSNISRSTGGLNKLGAGNLTLSSFNDYTGQTTVNQGTLTLAGGNNTLAYNNNLMVNKGGTLDLAANNQYVNQLSSAGTVENTGGNIIGTGTLTANTGNNTFAGNLGGTGGSAINLVKVGVNTLTLVSGNTTTGAVSVIGGTLTLKDGGALSGASAINVTYSTLTLDNTGFKDSGDRLNNSTAINLNGSTFNFNGAPSVASTETLGAVNLSSGQSQFNVSPFVATNNIVAGGADLTLSSLTRTAGSAATVYFNPKGPSNNGAYGQAGLANPRINITTAPTLTNNIIGPWAVVMQTGNNNNGLNGFASYIPYTTANGVTTGGLGSLGDPGYAAYDSTAVLNGTNQPTWNVKNIGTITGSNTIYSLNDTTPVFAAADAMVNLVSGGWIIGVGGQAIGASLDSGRITAGGTNTVGINDLYLYNYTNSRTLNSRVVDNTSGGSVRLVLVAGDGNTITMMNNLNSYTGGTILNQNNTILGASAAGTNTLGANVIPAGGLTINNSTLTETVVGGQINPTNVVTLNGSSSLTLIGNNTLAGLVFNSNGGSGTPTVTPTGIMTITGDITSTPSNAGVTPIISAGNLDLAATTTHNISVSALSEGTTVNNIAQINGLNITSVIQNGGFAKTGSGVLQLSGVNTFAGGLTIKNGTVVANISNATTVSGAAGPSTVAITLGATGGSDPASLLVNSFTVTNAINLGTSTGTLTIGNNGGTTAAVFQGNIALSNNLTINSTGTTGTTTLNTGIVSGAGNLTKTGPTTLTLSAANTYTGVTTIDSGTLNSATIAAINTASGIGKGSALGSAADLVFGGGILQYNGGSAATTNRLFTIGDANGLTAFLDSSNGTAANTLSFTGTGAIAFGSSGARALTLTGSNTGANTFAPILGDGTGGATALNKTGNGAWTLTGINTYSGTTTVSAGTLTVSGSGTLGNGSSPLIMGGGTLDLGSTTNRTVGAVNLAAQSTIQTGSLTATSYAATNPFGVNGTNTTVTVTASLLGSGVALTKTGDGILNLSGTNSYSGGTTVNSGILSYQKTIAKPASGTTTVASGATLGLGYNSSGTYFTAANIDALFANTLAGVSMDPNANVGIDTSAASLTYSTIPASTTKGLTKLGGNTLTLNTNNSGMSIPMTITGGTLAITNAGALGTGTLTINPGATISNTLGTPLTNTGNNAQVWNGSFSAGGVLNLGTGAVSLAASPTNVGTPSLILTISGGSYLTVGGVISSNGAFGLTKTAAGVLDLTGVNTYTGGTTLQASGGGGILRVSGTGTLGLGTVTVNNIGILDITSSAVQTVSTVTNNGGWILGGTFNSLADSASAYSGNGYITSNLQGANAGLTANSALGLYLSGTNSYGNVGFAGINPYGIGTTVTNMLVPLTPAALPNSGASGMITVNGATGLLALQTGTGKWTATDITSLLNNPGFTFTAAGALGLDTTSGNFSYAAITDKANAVTTLAGLTKLGPNTLTLTGTSNYTGTTTINRGAIKLDAGAGASLYFNSTVANSSALTFSGTGTLNYDNTTASGAKAQTLGALTFSAGDGTVQVTRTAAQTVGLTFASLAARTAGATANFALTDSAGGGVNGTDLKVAFTAAPTASALISQGTFFNGSNYAAYDAGGFVRAMNYITDNGGAAAIVSTANATFTAAAANAKQVDLGSTGSISAAGSESINTLRIGANTTANTVVVGTGNTLTIATGGILKTGGTASTISGGTGLSSGSSELVIRTDSSSDSLAISTPILLNTVTKTGAGTLTLSGTNTFTALRLNQGQLNINSNTAFAASSTLTINEGTTLDNTSAATVTLTNNPSLTINGSFTYLGSAGFDLNMASPNSGGFNFVNDATVTVAAGTLSLKNVGTVTNATITKNGGGTLVWGGNGTLRNQGPLIVNNGVVSPDPVGQDYQGLGTGLVSLGDTTASNSNPATINMTNGNSDMNPITVRAGSSGTIAITNDNGDHKFTGPIALNNNLTLSHIVNTGTLGIYGSISGTGNINIGNTGSITVSSVSKSLANAGTVFMGAVNSYSGDTLVNSGKLQLGAVNALPSGSGKGNVTLAATTTLDLNQNSTAINGLSGTGTIDNTVAGTPTLTLGNNDQTSSFGGIIKNTTGTLALTKTGSGVLTLTGASTYSGATNVNTGTLLVSNTTGSGTGSGAVNVGAGATLGGSGTITGPVNVTGVLAPGASIGTLASGSLSFLNSSTYNYQVDSSVATSLGADLQIVNGALSLAGTVNLSLSNLGAGTFAAGTVFSLFNYTTAGSGLGSTGLFTYNSAALGDDTTFNYLGKTWTIDYNATTKGANVAGAQAGNYVNITAATPTDPYSIWASGTFAHTFSDQAAGSDPDGDTLNNLQEFAFGTDPTVSSNAAIVYDGTSVTTPGIPKMIEESGMYYAVFGRRSDYQTAGITYTVEFSADLSSGNWTASAVGLTEITSTGTIHAVKVPFPGFVNSASGPQKARFFRVGISQP